MVNQWKITWKINRMGSLRKDIENGSQWAVKAFKALGKNLDYSVKSVEHIENVFEEQFVDGQPIDGGLFSDGLGGKVFAIASYVGEVIIRNTKNTDWEFDPSDPNNEMNMMVSSKGGARIWPMQKLGKRLQNGNEDNVYHYTAIIVKKFNEDSASTEGNGDASTARNISNQATFKNKPWWKFW